MWTSFWPLPTQRGGLHCRWRGGVPALLAGPFLRVWLLRLLYEARTLSEERQDID